MFCFIKDWFSQRDKNIQQTKTMENKDILVLLVNCHGVNTPGKRSPDGKFREYSWGREINKMILEKLYTLGIKSIIVNPDEKEENLHVTARKANELYQKYKSQYKEIILLSPHVNAGPKSEWSNARGWCGYVYNKASAKSRKLVTILSDMAYNTYHLRGNRSVPSEGYYQANFCIVRETVMPAVLTENLFMTNHDDVEFLSSKGGKEIIRDLHVNSILEFIK